MVIKYDISQIPSNADMIEATLSMFFFAGDTVEQGKPNVCSLFTISKQWIDSEVTWNNADNNTAWENTDFDTKYYNPVIEDTVISPGGCDFDHDNLVIADYVDTNNWENYDVTDIVKKILTNEIPNYGFMIKQFVCLKITQRKESKLRMNWGRWYRSSEFEEVDKRPKLTVKYEVTAIDDNTVANKFISKIVTLKTANTLKILIPFEVSYNVSIIDIKGRKVFSFQGNGDNWFTIPQKYLSSGMHILSINTPEKTIVRKFYLVW